MQSSFSLNEKFREEKGVTLVDVLISISILAIGILAVTKMQYNTVRNTTSGNVMTLGTMLAHSRLEQIKNIADITDLDDPLHPLVAPQRFDEDGNPDPAGLYQITTVVNPAGGGIAALARDVAVTVSWNRIWNGNRQITFRTVTQGNGV